MKKHEEWFWLKFEEQNLSTDLKVVSMAKAKCELGHEWVWHDPKGIKGAGWYRKFTFEEYKKINNEK